MGDKVCLDSQPSPHQYLYNITNHLQVGESAQKTKAIINMAGGKVLFIDEAYVLNDQLYGKQALDTIVECVSGK